MNSGVDLLSRGAEAVVVSDVDVWFNGPDFLSEQRFVYFNVSMRKLQVKLSQAWS